MDGGVEAEGILLRSGRAQALQLPIRPSHAIDSRRSTTEHSIRGWLFGS